MALTRINRGPASASGSSGTQTATSGSFTPTQGNLIVVLASAIGRVAGNNVTFSVTHNFGGAVESFELLDTIHGLGYTAAATRTSILFARVIGNPSSGAVTITRNNAGDGAVMMTVLEYSGADDATPFRQTIKDNKQDTASSPSATFGSSFQSGSHVLTANTAIWSNQTIPSGYTELHSISTTGQTDDGRMKTAYNESPSSLTVTWAGNNGDVSNFVATEIQETQSTPKFDGDTFAATEDPVANVSILYTDEADATDVIVGGPLFTGDDEGSLDDDLDLTTAIAVDEAITFGDTPVVSDKTVFATDSITVTDEASLLLNQAAVDEVTASEAHTAPATIDVTDGGDIVNEGYVIFGQEIPVAFEDDATGIETIGIVQPTPVTDKTTHSDIPRLTSVNVSVSDAFVVDDEVDAVKGADPVDTFTATETVQIDQGRHVVDKVLFIEPKPVSQGQYTAEETVEATDVSALTVYRSVTDSFVAAEDIMPTNYPQIADSVAAIEPPSNFVLQGQIAPTDAHTVTDDIALTVTRAVSDDADVTETLDAPVTTIEGLVETFITSEAVGYSLDVDVADSNTGATESESVFKSTAINVTDTFVVDDAPQVNASFTVNAGTSVVSEAIGHAPQIDVPDTGTLDESHFRRNATIQSADTGIATSTETHNDAIAATSTFTGTDDAAVTNDIQAGDSVTTQDIGVVTSSSGVVDTGGADDVVSIDREYPVQESATATESLAIQVELAFVEQFDGAELVIVEAQLALLDADTQTVEVFAYHIGSDYPLVLPPLLTINVSRRSWTREVEG